MPRETVRGRKPPEASSGIQPRLVAVLSGKWKAEAPPWSTIGFPPARQRPRGVLRCDGTTDVSSSVMNRPLLRSLMDPGHVTQAGSGGVGQGARKWPRQSATLVRVMDSGFRLLRAIVFLLLASGSVVPVPIAAANSLSGRPLVLDAYSPTRQALHAAGLEPVEAGANAALRRDGTRFGEFL